MTWSCSGLCHFVLERPGRIGFELLCRHVNHGHTKLLDPDHIRGDQAIPKARRDTFFNTLLEKVAKELSGSDYHLARILKYSGDLTRQKKKSAIEGAWVAFAPYHTRARQRGPDFFMAYDEGAAFCAASSIYV